MPDALVEAVRSGKLSAVRAVLKSASGEARKPRAVLEAGRLGFQAALELLHRHGADLNASWRGYRPLHSLLQEDAHTSVEKPSRERLSCLDWLLQNGADPEQTGAWPPARAIIVAAFVGVAEFVERLREAGAKVDGFVAAALGDVGSVEVTLRERPAFALERDAGGLTALQCAAGSRMPGARTDEVGRILIAAGSDIRAHEIVESRD